MKNLILLLAPICVVGALYLANRDLTQLETFSLFGVFVGTTIGYRVARATQGLFEGGVLGEALAARDEAREDLARTKKLLEEAVLRRTKAEAKVLDLEAKLKQRRSSGNRT